MSDVNFIDNGSLGIYVFAYSDLSEQEEMVGEIHINENKNDYYYFWAEENKPMSCKVISEIAKKLSELNISDD